MPKQGIDMLLYCVGKIELLCPVRKAETCNFIFFLKQQKYSIFKLISNIGCTHKSNKSWWTLGQFAVSHCHSEHKGTEPNQVAAIITELKTDHVFKDPF